MGRADGTLVFDADTSAAEKALGGLQKRLDTLAVGFLTKQLIDLADAGTVLQNKLKSVSSSTEVAAKAFESVNRIAMTTGTSISAVGDLYQKIALQSKALGLSQTEVARITENFSKALTITGTTGNAAASAIYQFAQSLGRGKVAYEDIKQLQEASSATVTLIASRFKMSGQEFLEAVQKGKVSSQELALAVNALGSDVDGTFNSMHKTVGQSMENIKTAFITMLTKFEESTGAFDGLAKTLNFLAEHMDTIAIAAGTFMTVFSAAKIMEIVVAVRALNVATKANPFLLVAGLAAGYLATVNELSNSQDDINEKKKEELKTEEKIRDVKDAVIDKGKQQLKDLADYLTKARNEAQIAGLYGEELSIRKAIINAANQLKISEKELTKEVIAQVVGIERMKLNNEAMAVTKQKLVSLGEQITVLTLQDSKEQEIQNGLLDYKHTVTSAIYEKNKASIEFYLRQTQALKEVAGYESDMIKAANARTSSIKEQLDMMEKLRAAGRSQIAIKEVETQINDKIKEQTVTDTNQAVYIMDVLNKEHERLLVTKQLIAQSTLSESAKAALNAQIEAKMKYDMDNLDIKLFDARMAREEQFWDYKQKRYTQDYEQMGWSLAQAKQMATDRAAFEKKTDSERAQWAMEQGASVFDSLGKVNKKAFEASKAYNIAQAIMNTYTGATKALATYPPPFNFIAAGATIAMGLAQIATIRSQQYSGRAIGGPVIANKSYVVGEKGPEVFTPTGSGTITPNNQLGGDVINVNFNIKTNDGNSFTQALAQNKQMIVSMVRSAVNDKGRQFSA